MYVCMYVCIKIDRLEEHECHISRIINFFILCNVIDCH